MQLLPLKHGPSRTLRFTPSILISVLVGLGAILYPCAVGADDLDTHAQAIENLRAQITDAHSYGPMYTDLNRVLARYQAEIDQQEAALSKLRQRTVENEARCSADADCSGWLNSIWSKLSTSYSAYGREKQAIEAESAEALAAIADIKTRAISENTDLLDGYGITDFDLLSDTVAEFQSKAENCWTLRQSLETYCNSEAVRELNDRCFHMPIGSVGWTEEKIAFNESWCQKGYCSVLTWPRCD